MILIAGQIFIIFLLKFFQNMFAREDSILLKEIVGQTGETEKKGMKSIIFHT